MEVFKMTRLSRPPNLYLKWVLVPDEWTEEAGQMTPSMKLKRGVVQKEYEAQIEEIFA